MLFLTGLLLQSLCVNTPVQGPPAPIWPDSPEQQKLLLKQGTHGYLSADHTEVVLILRAENGSTKVKRYPLHNRIDANVRVSITKSPSSYRYSYTFENNPDSKDPINIISLVLPPKSDSTEVKVYGALPDRRWVGFGGSSLYLIAPQAELITPVLGLYASWVREGTDYRTMNVGGINPGASLSGFELVSSFRPGFTTVYLLGDLLGIPDEDFDYPGMDLWFTADRRWSEAHTLALAPMFNNSTSCRAIVANFRDGVGRSLHCRRNPLSLAYLGELDALLARAGSSCTDLNQELSRLPVAREGSFESQVLSALRFALEGVEK